MEQMPLRRFAAFILLLALFYLQATAVVRGIEAAPPPCAGSLNVSRFRLLVEPPASGSLLPLTEINVLKAGQKVKYEPLHVPPAIRDRAKVALILVAAPKAEVKEEAKKQETKTDADARAKEEMKEAKQDIHVLEALPAKDPQEWKVPARASVVGIVFGPHGLDVKKVSSMVIKNPDLIPQLTEYAEQTAKVGALVEALTEYQQKPDPNRDVNAALAGFGSQYNVAVPKIDATQPSSQQAAVLLQAMMPSLQTFDPITATPTGMVTQSTGLAGAVATMFFGSPAGLAAGGAALFLNMRTLVFPDTDFRSAFTQPFAGNGLSLCAKNEPERARTRLAYLWMMRVPNTEAPAAALQEPEDLPIGGKSVLKVACTKPAEQRLLLRAHGWELVSGDKRAEVPVKVQVGATNDLLDLDLGETKLPAGQYHLAALWDWDPLEVKGDVQLRPLGDFSKAVVAPESADRLVEGVGPTKVQLTGADFEFVQKVTLAKAGDKKSPPQEVGFTLPKGKAQGEQESMETEVDTTGMKAGSYHLILAQADGSAQNVAVTVHPPNPTLDGLPLRANLGETQQTVVLHGSRLERITKITSADATWELAATKPDAHDVTERRATVKLQSAAQRGESPVSIFVQDLQSPLEVPGALEIAGPRPKITGFSLSLAQQPDVHLNQGEIPAGAPTSFSLVATNSDARPTLSLGCANEGFVRVPLVLHPGDRTGNAQLDFAGDGGLFLSVDPGVVGQSGCQLAATLTTEEAGSSDPTVLGRVIRLPRIEKFALSDEKLGADLYAGTLTGVDLQIIDKIGWDGKAGYPVQGIPTPTPGLSQQQTLRVGLPWPPPSPHAPIYVWLRGETSGRLTDAKY